MPLNTWLQCDHRIYGYEGSGNGNTAGRYKCTLSVLNGTTPILTLRSATQFEFLQQGFVSAIGGVQCGNTATYNVTAAAVIKATAGRVWRIVVIAPGTTGGVLTLNDCAATADAAIGNEIFSVGFAGLTAGQVITLEWPCRVGIVVSAVPSGGSPIYAVSWA